MEYLVVRFGAASERRGVLVDDNPFGLTNTLIQVEAGTHTITLVPPPDFSPAAQTVVIADTSELAPFTVTFLRTAA